MKALFVSSTILRDPANFFVAALYDESALSVCLESFQIPKIGGTYGNPFQYAFNYNLIVGHNYNMILWESADATPTGTERNSTDFVANQTTTTIRTEHYMVVGTTPGLVAGQTAYVDATLVGWQYWIERTGQKTMFPQGEPDVTDPDYAQDDAGGFHLLRTGDVFGQNGEEWVIHFLPQVQTSTPGGQPGPPFGSGQIIAVATVMDNTYLNKALFIQGAGLSVPLTLPPLETVLDYSFINLYSAGGLHISAPIITSGSDLIQRHGLGVTQIFLNQNNNLKLFKANGVWNIDGPTDFLDRVGEIIDKYDNTGIDFNTYFCNGDLLSRTTFARLWNYVSKLPPGILISDAAWTGSGANQAKFSVGDNATTFRIPALYVTGFLRPVDGSSRLAGDWKNWQFLDHQHGTLIGEVGTYGTTPGTGNGGAYANYKTSTVTRDLVSRATDKNGNIISTVGSEPYPMNSGIYKLIRI